MSDICYLRATSVEWGRDLLDEIAAVGFAKANSQERDIIITSAPDALAEPLRDIIGREPSIARIKGRSAEAVIHELRLQAEEKGSLVKSHSIWLAQSLYYDLKERFLFVRPIRATASRVLTKTQNPATSGSKTRL